MQGARRTKGKVGGFDLKRTFEYSITVIVDGPNEIPSDDAIDHAQTTLREFEGDTPPAPVRRARTASEDEPRKKHISDVLAQNERRRFRHYCGVCGECGYNRRTCTYPTPIRDIPEVLNIPTSPTYHP